MFENFQPLAEAKAFSFPSLKLDGKSYTPVAVKVQQGLDPVLVNSETEKTAKSDSQKYPLRLFHLIDVSSSMDQSLNDFKDLGTRLNIVKKNIASLVKKLPQVIRENIEHVLIPYADDVIDSQSFQKERPFLNAVNKLGKHYGTNIALPLQEVIKDLKTKTKDGYRNLAILFSDGQHRPREDNHTILDIHRAAKELAEEDCGLFNVGIDSNYNRQLLQASASAAAFAGMAHLPVAKGDHDLYQIVLPDLIEQIVSAPHYPIISFNKWFDHVINFSPTTKLVNKEEDEHLAKIGYQNEGYVLGLIPKEKALFAEVKKTVQDKAGTDAIIKEQEKIHIIPINEAILDPSERELLESLPLEAIKHLLFSHGFNEERIMKFIDENHLNESQLGELEKLIEKIFKNNDANSGKSANASADGDATAGVIQRRKMQATKNEETLLANDAQEETIANYPVERLFANSLSQVFEARKDINAVRIKLIDLDNRQKQIEVKIENNGSSRIIGRSENANLITTDDLVSRQHAEIYMQDGEIKIRDMGSRNGTFVNGRKIKDWKSLKDMDLLKFGSKTFMLHFSLAS